MSKLQEDRYSGRLKIGVIESIDTDAYRCSVNCGDSLGASRSVICNPHPSMGIMPAVGSLVAIYDKGGISKRVISVLDITEPGVTMETLFSREDAPGDVPRMNEGDCYIGRFGRAYFDSEGNVKVGCMNDRAVLNLISSKGKAELFGNTFHIRSTGSQVGLRANASLVSSFLPIAIADEIWMESNIAAIPMTPNSKLDVLPKLKSHIGIDFLGNIEAALYATPLIKYSRMTMDVIGAMGFERPSVPGSLIPTVGLSISPLEDIKLRNTKAYVRVDALGGVSMVTGDAIIGTMFQGFDCDISGDIKMFNPIASLEFQPSGSMLLSNGQTSLSCGISGSATLAAIDAMMLGTNTAIMQAFTAASIYSPLINLGLAPIGHVALSEMLVLIFTQLNIFNIKLQGHGHPIIGAVTTGLGAGGAVIGTAAASPALAGGAPMIPTLAQLGSLTVSAQA